MKKGAGSTLFYWLFCREAHVGKLLLSIVKKICVNLRTGLSLCSKLYKYCLKVNSLSRQIPDFYILSIMITFGLVFIIADE